jgi:hypothetical protein
MKIMHFATERSKHAKLVYFEPAVPDPGGRRLHRPVLITGLENVTSEKTFSSQS